MKGERIRELIPAAVLVTAVFALYAVTAGFGFLRFDDPDYTFACPFVKNGLTWSGVKEAFANARHGAIWMPITWLSYMIDIAFFGSGAGPHHVVNALLHAANAVLLLALGRRLGGCATRGATHTVKGGWHWGLVALVACWALHPQRVEAVAWIASRKELLWAFFTLWGLLAWHKGRGLVACGCCALACMCKPTAMVFPFLALLVGREKTVGGVRALGALLPLMALAAVTGGLAVYSQMHPEGMAAKDLFYAGWGERLLNAAVAIGLYVWQMVVPVGLHLDYRAVPGGWPVDGVLGLAAFGVVAGLVICAARGATRTGGAAMWRGVVWGLGWFLVTLAPTLGIFGSFGEHARADRFLYVPAMFLPLAFARWGKLKGVKALMLGYLAFLVVQAVPLILSYRTDEAAFSRALAYDANHGRALAHVGEARCAAAYDPAREGAARAALLDEGIAMLRRSQEVRPRDVTAGKLAYALMKRGRVADWDEIRSICSGQRTMDKGQRGRLNDASRGQGTEPLSGTLADRDQKGQALEALGTAELRTREWRAAAEHLSRAILAPGRFYSAEDAQLKLAFALHNGGQHTAARRLFGELAKSTRADISARAEEACSVLRRSPNAMLFW
ncbi:MAG: hypothetical protein MJ240_13170 [Kiritimatiellae bacterium]|nr:hypothetical protein [Kiritimatiellia bacterium]